MMRVLIYAAAGAVIFVMCVYAMIARRDLIRRIIAANAMGAGVFLIFVAIAARVPDTPLSQARPDPVPHAMVLTGIVVAVSATALGLRLARQIHASSGKTCLPEDE